jgi:hypothetical protein
MDAATVGISRSGHAQQPMQVRALQFESGLVRS